ncbi:response regulator transcription factor [Streptomyces monticola]|uniref:Response regulator transcription factor n=1 Tax=Streptomyces monticola TaxID=2666263 RepID=A0ABW2JXM8_9ACTN
MEDRHATLHVLPTAGHAAGATAGGTVRPPDPGPAPQPLSGAAEHGAPVRVHIMAADPLARVGIKALLEGHPGIRVTGDTEPGPAAIAALRALRPHVLVAHGPLPAAQRELIAQEAGEEIRLLTMGGTAPGPGAPDAVHGHLPGAASARQLASAVVLAAAGYTLVRAPADGIRTAPVSQLSKVSPEELTERECEVLALLARGLSNGEIAETLTVSEHTVKTHVQNLLHKLRLRNRVHAAIYAFETGLRRPC